MKKLEVGNVIYGKNRIYGIREVFTIERVTKTQAISGNSRFKIETYDGRARMVGDQYDGFNRTSYYLETEELKEEFIRQKAIEKLKNAQFYKLPTKVLKQINLLIDQNNNQ